MNEIEKIRLVKEEIRKESPFVYKILVMMEHYPFITGDLIKEIKEKCYP